MSWWTYMTASFITVGEHDPDVAFGKSATYEEISAELKELGHSPLLEEYERNHSAFMPMGSEGTAYRTEHKLENPLNGGDLTLTYISGALRDYTNLDEICRWFEMACDPRRTGYIVQAVLTVDDDVERRTLAFPKSARSI